MRKSHPAETKGPLTRNINQKTMKQSMMLRTQTMIITRTNTMMKTIMMMTTTTTTMKMRIDLLYYVTASLGERREWIVGTES